MPQEDKISDEVKKLYEKSSGLERVQIRAMSMLGLILSTQKQKQLSQESIADILNSVIMDIMYGTNLVMLKAFMENHPNEKDIALLTIKMSLTAGKNLEVLKNLAELLRPEKSTHIVPEASQ